ncbi:hypothetical protein [Streptomyces sp. NPDC000888]
MICTLCTNEDTRDDERLCHGCTRTTHERLQRLPRMWAALEQWLTPGNTGAPMYGGRVRPAHAPLPLREDVLSLRAAGGIVGILEDWRAAMQQARGWGPPALETGLARRVAVAARALDHNLEWIVRWEEGPTFADEIRQLVHRALAAAQPPEPRKRGTLLGTCIAVDPSGVVCGADLWVQPGQRVKCEWCLCRYPPDTWLALLHHQPTRPPAAEDQDDEQGEPAHMAAA